MSAAGETPHDDREATGAAASAARCRHFGICGGCSTQDLDYSVQVERKQSILNELLAPHSAKLRQVVAAPSPWFYRNKMEFAFGFKGEETALGLRRRGRFYGVVDLEECFLMSETVGDVLRTVRAWATEHELRPYHLRRHTGFLRYLVLREGKRTGERMAILVTASPEDESAFLPKLDELTGRLKALGATSFLWAVTERQADLAQGEIRGTLLGEPILRERMGGVDFLLSPYAFFQPNVEQTDRLIERAREHLGEGWPMLIDLYSGVGGLSLSLSAQAKRVIGVEMDPAATADAQRNASANGRGNCSFVAEDSRAFLRRFSNYSFMTDRWAVVLDPPRAGMHPKMPAQLLRVAPPLIIYVSCNPKKLAEDLAQLEKSYQAEEIIPYDFFPHTPHIEILAKLVRR
jgi:23S rRNA (uracil1939-C5)-methyltransferase